MENGNTLKKHKGKFRLALLLIIVYMIILIFISIKPSSTTRIVYGSVESTFDTSGFIIRNEKIVYSPKSGYLYRKTQDNIRVPKGCLVVQLSSKKYNEDLFSQLDNINRKIKLAENKNTETFADDISKIENEIEQQLNDIKNKADKGVLYTSDESISDLSLLIDKKKALTINNPITEYNVTKMEKEKEEIENMIKVSYTDVNSPEAGIVSFAFDGYENINVNNIDNYNIFAAKPKNYTIGNNGDFINEGEPLFKMIDNYEWYIYIKIPQKDLILNEGEKLKLNINGDTLDAKVMNTTHTSTGRYALLMLSQQYSNMLTDRFINLKIIKNSGEGLMIPNEFIIDNNKKHYVYKNDSGDIKGIEVNIIATDGEKSIVESIDKLNGLKIYDEVMNKDKVISKYLQTKE